MCEPSGYCTGFREPVLPFSRGITTIIIIVVVVVVVTVYAIITVAIHSWRADGYTARHIGDTSVSIDRRYWIGVVRRTENFPLNKSHTWGGYVSFIQFHYSESSCLTSPGQNGRTVLNIARTHATSLGSIISQY